jgi:hypothetical protein
MIAVIVFPTPTSNAIIPLPWFAVHDTPFIWLSFALNGSPLNSREMPSRNTGIFEISAATVPLYCRLYCSARRFWSSI